MHKSTTTVLSQLRELLPMNEFEGFVGQHHSDRYVKHFTTENQLTTLLLCTGNRERLAQGHRDRSTDSRKQLVPFGDNERGTQYFGPCKHKKTVGDF